MNSKQSFIAVFDSGVGGISVLRQLRRLMPGEKYLYFGDSANAPYGTRPVEEVRKLSMAVADKLVAQGIKALVVACNTSTATGIELLREKYPELIIEGIRPAVDVAAEQFPGKAVGVMATPVTIAAPKTQALMKQYEDRCKLIPLPAPGLVDLVEAGKGNSAETVALLRPMLEPLRGKVDAIVLGCTHYPFATEAIRSILGDVAFVDGGVVTAKNTYDRLKAADLICEDDPQIVWQSSLDDPRIQKLSLQLLDM